MRKIFLGLVIFCLCTPWLYAVDLPLSLIKPEILEKYLPENWKLDKISQVNAPSAWKTSQGGKGIRIEFSNPKVTIPDSMVGDYHPFYSFTLMPLDWEGDNELGYIFKNGKLVRPANEYLKQQIYPDQFQRKFQNFYVFDSYLGKGDWKNPFEDLRKYFEENNNF